MSKSCLKSYEYPQTLHFTKQRGGGGEDIFAANHFTMNMDAVLKYGDILQW